MLPPAGHIFEKLHFLEIFVNLGLETFVNFGDFSDDFQAGL